MSELQKVETLSNNPFKCMVATIGNLPTSFVDSMSYYELLAWLCNYIKNTVIPTVNNNAEAVEELQAKYIELKAYVDDYFDNLDVQEEINNKLDAMAEAGTLQEIISEYLNSTAVFGFNNVAEMVAAPNLIDGSYARTLGYYAKNDGGGALYKIRDITNDDVVDGISIIEMGDTPDELVAELVIEGGLSLAQCGCKAGDDTFDNSIVLAKAIAIAVAHDVELTIPEGDYYCATPVALSQFTSNLKMRGYSNGAGDTSHRTKFIYTGTGFFLSLNGSEYCTFSNFAIQGDFSNNGIYLGGAKNNKDLFDHITIAAFVDGIKLENGLYCHFDYIDGFAHNATNSLIWIRKNGQLCEYTYIENSTFEAQQSTASNGIIIDSATFVYVNKCDVCNFYSGNGINLINEVNCVWFDQVSTVRNYRHYNFNTGSSAIMNINFNNLLINLFGSENHSDEVAFYFTGDWSHHNSKITGRNINVRSINWTTATEYLIKGSGEGAYSKADFEFTNYHAKVTKVDTCSKLTRVKFTSTENFFVKDTIAAATLTTWNKIKMPKLVDYAGTLVFPSVCITNTGGVNGALVAQSYVDAEGVYMYQYTLPSQPANDYQVQVTIL